MAVESHVVELHRKHEALDVALHEEELHAARDNIRIADLKRQKLRIKEELGRLDTH